MKCLRFVLMAVIGMLFFGCGTANHNVSFIDGYQCPVETKIYMPKPVNDTGKIFSEIDVEESLLLEMEIALTAEGIFGSKYSSTENILSMPCKIIEYEPGDAFKRWLWPGYGSTVLNVKCVLKDFKTENLVGYAEARHTVDAGGGYTIGAWKKIFKNLSTDLVKEVKTQLPNNGLKPAQVNK